MENRLEFKNPHDDKQLVADFNLAVFQMLCDAAKEIASSYAAAVDNISSKVIVFGASIKEEPEAKGVCK